MHTMRDGERERERWFSARLITRLVPFEQLCHFENSPLKREQKASPSGEIMFE